MQTKYKVSNAQKSSHFSSTQTVRNTVYPLPHDKNTTCSICRVSADTGNTARLFVAAGGEGAGGGGGGVLNRVLSEPYEAGPPRVASGAWQRFREVGRRSGSQPVPGAEAAGGSRDSEALPEWTQIFSTAHKDHFSFPEPNRSDRECVLMQIG